MGVVLATITLGCDFTIGGSRIPGWLLSLDVVSMVSILVHNLISADLVLRHLIPARWNLYLRLRQRLMNDLVDLLLVIFIASLVAPIVAPLLPL